MMMNVQRDMESPIADMSATVDLMTTLCLGDGERVASLQKILGAAVKGVGTRKAYVLYGDGANGKSLLFDLLFQLMGDACVRLPPSAITKESAISPHTLALLKDKRIALVVCDDDIEALDEEKVRQLIGDREVEGRKLYGKEVVTFKPSLTLFILTNGKPTTSELVTAIPFEAKFVTDPREPRERKVHPDLAVEFTSNPAKMKGFALWLAE